ncbi:hypothetical protein IWQ62_001697 [Dispira parvispora]|uniref:U1 small nuclear ribonucleoprotein 70 kDa n=1 Tax=Dispira parvispora TaxID=1520584 RepID=A0A9W8AVH5_9FUNG|nr:hypothetical protein IWQ62_001697 [Dispira parvispora]
MSTAGHEKRHGGLFYKSISFLTTGTMTDHLPPNLMMLFAPRPPLAVLPPLDRDPNERRGPTLTGIGAYANMLKDENSIPPLERVNESKINRRKRVAEEKRLRHEERVEEEMARWAPDRDEQATSDAYRTLFVARLPYDITEKELVREFELYGKVVKARVVRSKETGEPRGYGFVEFEQERALRVAFRESTGVKLKGRRIVVDVERGRTVKGWKPRRLGGGLGHTRSKNPEKVEKDGERGGDQYRTSDSSRHYRSSDSYRSARSDYSREYRRERERSRDDGYGSRRYGRRDHGYERGSRRERDRREDSPDRGSHRGYGHRETSRRDDEYQWRGERHASDTGHYQRGSHPEQGLSTAGDGETNNGYEEGQYIGDDVAQP